MNGWIQGAVKSTLLVFFAAVFLVGCGSDKNVATIEQICVPATDKSTAVKASEKILEKMHFTVEKSDVEQGIVQTLPLMGGQFFEFWRKDNVGKFNTKEANIQDIRRLAEINVSDSTGELCIKCTVESSRLNMPTHEGSSAKAYRMFSKSGQSTQRLRLYPDQIKDMTWTDLGRDERLETRILEKIKKELTVK